MNLPKKLRDAGAELRRRLTEEGFPPGAVSVALANQPGEEHLVILVHEKQKYGRSRYLNKCFRDKKVGGYWVRRRNVGPIVLAPATRSKK